MFCFMGCYNVVTYCILHFKAVEKVEVIPEKNMIPFVIEIDGNVLVNLLS